MELYLEVNVLLKFVLLIWCNKQFLCICNARQRHGKGMERGMNPDVEVLDHSGRSGVQEYIENQTGYSIGIMQSFGLGQGAQGVELPSTTTKTKSNGYRYLQES